MHGVERLHHEHADAGRRLRLLDGRTPQPAYVGHRVRHPHAPRRPGPRPIRCPRSASTTPSTGWTARSPTPTRPDRHRQRAVQQQCRTLHPLRARQGGRARKARIEKLIEQLGHAAQSERPPSRRRSTPTCSRRPLPGRRPALRARPEAAPTLHARSATNGATAGRSTPTAPARLHAVDCYVDLFGADAQGRRSCSPHLVADEATAAVARPATTPPRSWCGAITGLGKFVEAGHRGLRAAESALPTAGSLAPHCVEWGQTSAMQRSHLEPAPGQRVRRPRPRGARARTTASSTWSLLEPRACARARLARPAARAWSTQAPSTVDASGRRSDRPARASLDPGRSGLRRADG